MNINLITDADKGGQILICLILVTLRQMSSFSFVLSFVKWSYNQHEIGDLDKYHSETIIIHEKKIKTQVKIVHFS